MLANFQHFSGRTHKSEDFPVNIWGFNRVVEALFEFLCKNELEKAVLLFSETSNALQKSSNDEDIKKLYIGKFSLTKSSC